MSGVNFPVGIVDIAAVADADVARRVDSPNVVGINRDRRAKPPIFSYIGFGIVHRSNVRRNCARFHQLYHKELQKDEFQKQQTQHSCPESVFYRRK